jgi:hypothetical protein
VNQQKQAEALTAKLLVWVDRIRTKHLRKTEAWPSLRMGITKALQYPLTATSHSKVHCKSIDVILTRAALPALCFPASFPHAIAQAPPEVIGLGIPSIWTLQGIDHIAAILRHGDSSANNVTDCILRDVMATLRIQLGLPGTIFDHPYKRFALCTTPTYFHTTWEFCNDHAFIIQDNQPLLQLQRINDQFLIQAFADSGHSNKELRQLNICRMWAKVVTLADITTGDGNHLMPESLEKNFTSKHHTARDWPLTPPPNAQCWKLWADTVEKCFVREHDHHQRLRVDLGPWTMQPTHWKWFFIPSQDRLVEQTDDASWIQYERTSGAQATRHQGFRRTLHTIPQLPMEAQPTSIFGRQTLRMRGSAAILPKPAEDPTKWWYEIIEAPTNHVQYADFQEAHRAQATGCDCGLNLLVQSLLNFI